MKYRSFILILFLINNPIFSQSTFFVKYKESVSQAKIEDKILTKQIYSPSKNQSKIETNALNINYFAKGLGKEIESLSRIIRVDLDSRLSAEEFINLMNQDPEVEYVQRSIQYKVDFIPNDSLINEQWGLYKINAFSAWDITEGADSILLAIIDTGIDYLHPDLKNKIFINSGEIGTDRKGNDKRFNNVDDDNNGFIDDYMGWDFTDRVGFPFDSTAGDYLAWDNDPSDDNGHGTYIAGIAAAEANNKIGIAGVAPKIRLLNLRAFDPGGYGDEDDAAAAILYAVQNGAKIVNMSFGDVSFSFVLRDVIRYAYSKNVVLVASSGNRGSNEPHYPSGYPEVISVGNSNIDDQVSASSSYGSTLDLVAPGSSILTTDRKNAYASVSGTSASAPHISAAAALVLSMKDLKNEEVKQILKSTADDIGQSGWDIKTGAGRLNLFRALSVLAPSRIMFDYPSHNFSTSQDYLSIRATVISPYFQYYDLYLGTGLNPVDWQSLITKGTYQFSNKEIYNLSLTQLKDSLYTLRLMVKLNNGKTLEERINFYVDRTPPITELISIGPAYYGKRTTLLSAVYTNEPSILKMYYRKQGESNFKFITLDGFNINNQFVKTFHYGFIPVELIEQNINYEIYLEAVNLAGLKTTIRNGDNYFLFFTENDFKLAAEYELPFSLPAGYLFAKPLDLTTTDYREVALRSFNNARITSIYKLNDNQFEKIDSLPDRIIKDYGNFNNNGKKDLLSFFVRSGYIQEQESAFSSKFLQKYVDTTGSFWPILADDIDGDSITEILALSSDSSITIWKCGPDLNLINPVKLTNFSPKGSFNNLINSPDAIITDMNNDGRKEIWMIDKEGDIVSHIINGPGDIRQDKVFATGFLGDAALLTSGDYDYDGSNEIAVLLHSIDELDIAPFYRLLIFNLKEDSINVLLDWAFIDVSSEFNTNFQRAENSLLFSDIDKDGSYELILFIYPYAYIIKREGNKSVIISYKENVNSNSIFVGDINRNGVPEIAFPASDGIKFFEFTLSEKTSTPHSLIGYSIDSIAVLLNWEGEGSVSKYFIYKGLSSNSLELFDSTSIDNFYTDNNVSNNTNYYYAVQAFDAGKKFPYSNLSSMIVVYNHLPARAVAAFGRSLHTVEVEFSERVSNSIGNFVSFEVRGAGFPNSVSPLSQYKYLLTFSSNLPAGENKLIVKDLKDFYGSPIKSDTLIFFMDTEPSALEFFVTSCKIITPYKIQIEFNLDVDEKTAVEKSNYSFEPANGVANIDIDAGSSKIIYLTLDGSRPVGSIGREYRLRIESLTSSESTGNIRINSGAGSYIVLTKSAENLQNVYVYPNPVKVSKNEKMTFANLTQRAKIIIFNIEGKRMAAIEEIDGNGGVDFNLRDDSGMYLPSGIYFYHIVSLDEFNNEMEKKIGKFAIIR